MPASGRGTERLVRDLADLVVAEVVALRSPLADDATSPELVERAHEAWLVIAARRSEHVAAELSANRGGDPDELASGRRELRQPRLDDRLDSRRGPWPVVSRAPSGANGL